MMDRPPPPELLQFLTPYPPELVELYLSTRKYLFTFAPTANEVIWDAANAVTLGLSFTEKWQDGFVHLPIYPKHINLGFNRGAELSDPDCRLLGTGSTVRHIKVTPKLLADEYISELIQQARDRSKGAIKGENTTMIRVMNSAVRRRPLS